MPTTYNPTINSFPNKYDAKCAQCGRPVSAGNGTTQRNQGDGPKWLTFCREDVLGLTPTPHVVDQASRPTFPLTDEQLAAVAAFEGGQSIAIQAGAGTGKTSTLIAIAKSTNRIGQYIAFNKTIAKEAGLKFTGTNCSASSFHSLAFQAVGKLYSKRLGSHRQSSREVAAQLGLEPFYYTVNGEDKVLQPTAIAGHVFKAISNFCISDSGRITIKFVPVIDGIDDVDDEGKRLWVNQHRFADQIFPAVKDAWNDILNLKGTLRFTHDHYFKIWELGIYGPPTIPGDYILFDESQDATPVFISVVEQQEKQVVWVGDSQQAIYEWRGAVNALDNVATEATTFLTNSFRFGEEIAAVANKILNQIESAELRIVGKGKPGLVGPVEVPEAVLTRTNAGAISVVLDYLGRNRTVFLLGGGGEVESFAKAAKKLQQTGQTDHPELAIFSSWGEVQDYVANDPNGSDLSLLVKLIDDHGVETILRAVQNTVSEEDADIVVTTAHKSKGREWDSVRLFGDFPENRTDDAERRLLYVAVTRAKLHLDIESCAPVVAILKGRV